MALIRNTMTQFQILTHHRHLYTVTLTYGRTTCTSINCIKHSDSICTQVLQGILKSVNKLLY